MFKINFVKENLQIESKEGETLLDLMIRAGIQPDAPCGGKGKCGKCLVKILGDQPVVVKSCETKPDRDMDVDTMQNKGKEQILTTGTGASVEFAPGLKQICVEVPPCPFGESVSDWTRFSTAVMEALQMKSKLHLNLRVASALGRMLKANENKVWAVVYHNRVLAVSPEKLPIYMAAFDIGTTTVAGYLVDGETGKQLTVSSRMNPQTQFGADVINRSSYCLEHGEEAVTACIRVTLNEMLSEMASKKNITPEEIYVVSVVGNTCMHHLFLGVDVDSLVHAPYNPAMADPSIIRAKDIDIKIQADGLVLMLPNIAGFVGADTVGCLVSTDLADQTEWTLLIDIGTNGEMVLGKEHNMVACSTAAGPAFEGAGITHGMRGAEGAISKVKWAEDHWECEIIGDAPAKGICGSGLLDAAAQLLRSGQMDETGEIEDGPTVILVPAENCSIDGPVTIEQKDIRELQLAKAAIATGIEMLTDSMNITYDDIAQVWLAGAFGSFLSPASACDIGLIPGELLPKIKAVGNAAGEGAKRVLLNDEQWKNAATLAREARFLELATDPEFQDLYVDHLEFPEFE